jgi:hypothetical protein
MGVMSSQSSTTSKLLKQLTKTYPELTFSESEQFYWSPKKMTVFYDPKKLAIDTGSWSLLHETSHGILGHRSYSSDFELLKYEVEAWQKAKDIAREYDIQIAQEHIEDCLDSYRDWLYARSTCTLCRLNSLQVSDNTYECLNCGNVWRVSASRFCRPYRMALSQ